MRMMKRKNKGVCVMLIAAFMLIGIFVFGQKTTVHAIPQTVQIVYGDVNSDGRLMEKNSDSWKLCQKLFPCVIRKVSHKNGTDICIYGSGI